MSFVVEDHDDGDGYTHASGRRRKPFRLSKLKLPKLKPPPAPVLAPVARKAVNGMIRKLATSSPDVRQRGVAHVQAVSNPATLGIVIDLLLAALKRNAKTDNHDGLVDTVVAFGADSLPAVGLALLKATSSRWQVTLAQVLERIGPTLPAGKRAEMHLFLFAMSMKATDPAASEALARALAVLRRAYGSADDPAHRVVSRNIDGGHGSPGTARPPHVA